MVAIVNPNKRGPQGEAGAKGDVGPKGDQGDRGYTGVKGDKGDTGERGPEGPSRRIEIYAGTTNVSDLFTVAYSQPFPATPHVSLSCAGASTEQAVRLVSSSASGFTAHAYARGGLTVLGLTLLALATSNVSGASISAQVTAA